MKHTCIIILALLLYCSAAIPAFSQDRRIPGQLGLISANEKSSFISFLHKQPSGLLNNYDLKYHRFQWLVDPSQRAIRGSVTSYYMPTAALMTSIQFELSEDLSADSAYHRGFKLEPEHSGNLVTVNFGEIIPMGALDSITIFYHGIPPSSGFGSFGTGAHNGAPALWTLSEPYGASDWWPSKNDLTDKIDSIDVYVAAPNGNKVASNGKFMGEQPFGPNLTVTHWKHRYPVVSYLIAIAVTNYIKYTEHFNGPGGVFPIENYVYPEDSAHCAFETGKLIPVYELFGNRFGNYPFEHEKYGHATFGWGGGMEHQTMTFIGQDAYNIEILSHELAHQWFGDMVTCGSWHDIWLNEGFATYCAGLMYEHLTPDTDWLVWKRQNHSWVTYYPDGSVYCDDTTSVSRIFDSRLSYSKGAMVLHQLRWVIGDEAFFDALRNYLEDPNLRHGFAMTADFRAHVEATSGMDMGYFFDDWIYHEGYPSYQVFCSQENGTQANVTIGQTQSHNSVEFFRLPVPLRFYGGSNDTTIVFDHTFSGQVFSCDPGFRIDSVHVDPDLWLISANNEVALGKEELPAGKFIQLHPNPASDILQASHNIGPFSKIAITAVNGKQVQCPVRENTDERLILDVNHLESGTYFLSLGNGNLRIIRKFTVVH